MASIQDRSTSNPQKKKQTYFMIVVLTVLLIVVMVAAWLMEESGESKPIESTKEPEKISMRLPGQQLDDKDIWRANEGSRVAALEARLKSMEDLYEKKDREVNQLDQNETVTGGDPIPGMSQALTDVPMPPTPEPVQTGKQHQWQAMPADDFTPPAQQQVQQGNNGKPFVQAAFSLDVPPPEDNVNLAQTQNKSANTTSSSQTTNKKDAPKTVDNYIPPGTVLRVVMLAGVDAPTGGQSQNNPHPVLFKVDDLARLPNRYKADFEECVITANAYGDISSERAYVRTDRFSCVDQNNHVIDIPIKAYAAGEDGKAGLRGRLVTKQGQVLANAFLAGVGSGIGTAFRDGATTQSTSALGTTQSIKSGKALEAGLGEGVSNAMDMLAQYYIRLAEQLFPVIEVDGGRVVDIVLTQGMSLEKQQ